MVLKTLDLVMLSIIFQYYQYYIKILDANHSKIEYKTKKFKKTIYYGYK